MVDYFQDRARAELAVSIDPDLGLVVLVGGQPHPVDAASLRLLGRQAIAHANAWEGVPPEDPPVVVEPFAPIRPGRLPVEAGIPPDVWANPNLSMAASYTWATLWMWCPHLMGSLRWRGRVASLMRLTRRSRSSVLSALKELEREGWATVSRRAEGPSGYGEIEVLLHLQRRADAHGAVLDTTAESKGEAR